MTSSDMPSPLLDDDDPALFPKLTDEQVALLARYGEERPIKVGEVLFREGDASYDAMVLLEGRVAVVLDSGDALRKRFLADLKAWQAKGQDKHSEIADPLFIDPEKDDYRLKPASPAEKIGFKMPDLSRVGPRPAGQRS